MRHSDSSLQVTIQAANFVHLEPTPHPQSGKLAASWPPVNLQNDDGQYYYVAAETLCTADCVGVSDLGQ